MVIVEKGGADVDVINKISQTPLLYACSEKHLEMGKYTHSRNPWANFPIM